MNAGAARDPTYSEVLFPGDSFSGGAVAGCRVSRTTALAQGSCGWTASGASERRPWQTCALADGPHFALLRYTNMDKRRGRRLVVSSVEWDPEHDRAQRNNPPSIDAC